MVIQLSQNNSLKRLSSHWVAFVHSLMDIQCQSIDGSCQACQKHLAAFMWVCLWAFFSISLVCMSGFFCLLAFCLFVCFFVSTVTYCLDYYRFIVRLEIRNWVLHICHFSKLLWLFKVPWDSIWILGWIFLFMQTTSLGFW